MSVLAKRQPGWIAIELVPLSDRVRYMRLFRIAAVATVVALVGLHGGDATLRLLPVAGVSLLYLAFAAAWDWVWQRSSRGLFLFSGLLLVDGVYLAWVTYVTGGSHSPVRYVILLHLIAIALLASYRTSLKLALWHSLLALVIYHAQQTGVLDEVRIAAAGAGSEIQRLTAFIVVFWLVALATASFSAVNERELRRRRLDLEALASFAGDLEAHVTPATIAQKLLDHLGDAYGIRRGAVVTESDDGLRLLAGGACTVPVSVTATAGEGSVLERVKRRGGTLLAASFDGKDDRWLAALMPHARNLIVVPLRAEERLVATLVCEYRGRTGSRVERRVVTMVERFAAHAALALHNSWLLETIRSAADTDGLTGLTNRRVFDETLARELRRAERDASQVSLVMLDIDHFKHLNDTYGHQVGDDVLRAIATALDTNSRAFDLPARYGGEEFAIILPGCGADEAAALGERLRRAATADVGCAPVTASAGVATYPLHALDADGLLAAADAALYRAKREGRDRLCAAEGLGAELVAATAREALA